MPSFLQQQLWYEKWNVGIFQGVPADLWTDPSVAARVVWGPSERISGFYADPFLWKHDGRYVVFCEEWVAATDRGHITVMDVDPDRPTQMFSNPRIAIAESYHLSYPFLFSYNGATFCLPESAHARKTVLYQAVEFPTVWKKITTILPGIAACDATLFQYEGNWWLACGNMDDEIFGQSLYLYYASSPLGPWKPHARNPVESNLRGARPGGSIVQLGDTLYRPAQSGVETYGEALTIYQITLLTPTNFEEQPVARVEPFRNSPYRDGLHHLSFADGLVMIDAKRFSPLKRLLYPLRHRRLRQERRKSPALRACLKSSPCPENFRFWLQNFDSLSP